MNYGLSSLDAVKMSGELEELIGRPLSPTLAYDYPNILTLSHFLAEDTDHESPAQENLWSGLSSEPIAIIGMACRFPGAKDTESFWDVLQNGKDCIVEIPQNRWRKEQFYNPDPAVPGKAISYWGGFLEDIDRFDPFFFGISPVEAKNMDPQQRLLMELSYEALDDAGYAKIGDKSSKTGVYIGISVNEYSQLQFADPRQITSHSGTGSALSIAANRISYFFNFRGPSVAIDTACSSSLAAVHMACQSLRNSDCDMALAGGVNMILSPAHSIAFTKAGVLAADGRCKTFDAHADGYVRGEGGGIIVLKKLASALADGDYVHSLILGSAISQDGRTNGLVAPNLDAQKTLLTEAYQSAGIAPEDIQYVEAHGTGTLLGDSIEAQALGAIIGKNRSGRPCPIGSVKTNIGHLESAAGIAGLIKVILSMKHRKIPASLHYHSANPHIPFDELNLKVNHKLTSWPSGTGPFLSGVSSFGFGGTIVHMIVSEMKHINPEHQGESDLSDDSKHYLLPLSSGDHDSLKSLAATFQELLELDSSYSLKDICYGASTRRSHFKCRMAVLGSSAQELSNGLEAFIHDQDVSNVMVADEHSGHEAKLAFVFSGQGGQWYGMVRDMLSQELVFYRTIERIEQSIRVHFSWSLMDVLMAEESTGLLDHIDVVQPTLFAVQVALAELWKSRGIIPQAVVGHSMGEVAAAHIAGILSLEDATKVICIRSKLMKEMSGQGSMIATELSLNQAQELLKKYENKISIAAINSPSSTILSGDPKSMDEIMNFIQSKNLFCRLVNVNVASHSPQMDGIRSVLLQELVDLDPKPPKLPFYSTVTRNTGKEAGFDAEYWMNNLREPVLFLDSVKDLLSDGFNQFIEISPHPTLLGAVQQISNGYSSRIGLFPSAHRDQSDEEVVNRTLAALHVEGFPILWENLYRIKGKHLNLPPIKWNRQRYWIDSIPNSSKNLWHLTSEDKEHGSLLLGDRIDLAHDPSSVIWQTAFHIDSPAFLGDHQIGGDTVFPATGYIEMALQSAKATGLSNSIQLSDLVLKERMTISKRSAHMVQAILSTDDKGNHSFRVYSKPILTDDWILNGSVTLIQDKLINDSVAVTKAPIDEIREQSSSQMTGLKFYQLLEKHDVHYGPSFRAIQHLWSKGNQSLAFLQIPPSIRSDSEAYQTHPAVLDACLQAVAATLGESLEHNLFFPIRAKSICFYKDLSSAQWSLVTLHTGLESGKDLFKADVLIMDDKRQSIAEFIDLELQRSSSRLPRIRPPENTWLYGLRWQEQHTRSLGDRNIGLPDKKHWIIFADNKGVGDLLAAEIEAWGDKCHILSCNIILDSLANVTDLRLPDIIEQCLSEVSSSLHGIIHLWSISMPSSSSNGLESSDLTQLLGCNSLLYLSQALAKRITGSPRLWIVTRGAQWVQSDEQNSLEQSTVLGFGKVINFELPDLKCTRIDLDVNQSNEESVSLLIDQLSVDDGEDQIAFRLGTRHVLRLVPFRQIARAELNLHADGTYLITGGLGGIGIETARWMGERGARHLLLISRGQPSDYGAAIIDQLRQEGIEVVIGHADVSRFSKLRDIIERAGKEMPPLRGVIHAAGVLDDASIHNLTGDRIKTVLAPKVDGTWNLHSLTLDQRLDFFVLFSSAVSVLGSPGQANYAAASTYLDAMAHYRRNMGLPAISINWGPWAEVGLAAETINKLQQQNASTQHLVKVIAVEQGLQILGQLLMEETAQIMVLPFELSNLIELYPAAAGMPFLENVGGKDGHITRLYVRPQLNQEYVAPRNHLERKLAALWQQTLHIDQVGVRDSFFELGGDSVLGAQLLGLAQKTFGIRINPQDAFKAFTIERLAEMLEAEIVSKIEDMSEEEARQKLSKESSK